jgi:hypothetical protein
MVYVGELIAQNNNADSVLEIVDAWFYGLSRIGAA